MLNFKKHILKSESFGSKKERLRGMILSLIVIVIVIILIFDVYGSYLGGYKYMAILEVSIIIISSYIYIAFPKRISLEKAIKFFLMLIMSLIVISLTLPGYNPEFSIFSLAAMPAAIFFLIGFKEAILWSLIVTFFIALSTINAYMSWVTPVFNSELLFQISIGYIAVSFFYYMIEKERVEYEELLQKIILEKNTLIKDKNILLKEVHHRAKNNLQTIMGILESQALRTKDKGCKKLLTSQRTRLQSMSLLHEFLAFDTDCEKVNMAEYLNQIIANIQKSTHHKITKNIDPFTLEMSDAVHLGLFLNEAVANAMEHAYDKEEIGIIDVILECKGSNCILSIEDYGKGFNQKESNNSLGLLLMDDISQFFTDGSMMMDFSEGTKISTEFKI